MNVHYYPPLEERFNIISHFTACVVSVVLGFFLVKKAYASNDFLIMMSSIIYSSSLILLFGASTMYHSAKEPRQRHLLNIFDHSSIYILIAGTYTPFALIAMEETGGWTLFKLVWVVTIIAIVFKFFTTGKFPILSAIIYAILGWTILFFINDLFHSVPIQGIYWLFVGGFFYTVGAIMFCLHKIDFNHAIFHILVVLGALSHFISIYCFVL